MTIFHKRRFFQSEAGAVAFQKMLGYGLFLCLEQDNTSFEYVVEALMAGKDAEYVTSHPYCVTWQTSQEN